MTNHIKINANAVWYIVYTRGKLSQPELERMTGIESIQLYLCLGWLAKEEKIHLCREGDCLHVELHPMMIAQHWF